MLYYYHQRQLRLLIFSSNITSLGQRSLQARVLNWPLTWYFRTWEVFTINWTELQRLNLKINGRWWFLRAARQTVSGQLELAHDDGLLICWWLLFRIIADNRSLEPMERSDLGLGREPGLIIRDQKNNEKNIQRCIKKSDNLQIVENQILKNMKIGSCKEHSTGISLTACS